MNLQKLMKEKIKDEISDIHVSLPAKIENFDPEKMLAKITLLSKNKLENENVVIPPILEVPVAHFNAGAFIIRPPYRKGDTVTVVFSERALDKITLTGEPEGVEYTRTHSFDDAIVIKSMKMENDNNLNSQYTEDLLIENTEQGSRIVLMANESKAFIKAGKIDFGTENAEFSLVYGEPMKETYNGHTHPGGSGGVTGVPNQAMTDSEHLSDVSSTD